MSDRKKIITTVAIIAVLLAGLFLAYIWFYKPPVSPNPPSLASPSTSPSGGSSGTITPPNSTATTGLGGAVSPVSTAQSIARSFVERWGSFSSETDFANVEDLSQYMTASMQKWARDYANQQRKKTIPGQFYGITTRAMTVQTLSEKPDVVRFRFGAQRSEVKGTAEANIFYQDMEVELKKEGEIWKVDGAWWKG